MTLQQAIDRVDMLRPNKITQEHKIMWLSELDGLIRTEIIDRHEGAPEEPFKPYSMDTDPDTVLNAPAPYDEIYTYYLELQCDMVNQELGKYQNDRTLFNNAYDTLSDYWTRTHMPLTNTRELVI